VLRSRDRRLMATCAAAGWSQVPHLYRKRSNARSLYMYFAVFYCLFHVLIRLYCRIANCFPDLRPVSHTITHRLLHNFC